MRSIRRLLLLALIGAGAVAAFNYWSDNGWPRVSRAAGLDAEQARQLVNRAAEEAGDAAQNVGGRMAESALTAKIKSKMALDDHVNARRIDVDTSGSVVTLTGAVASSAERERALRLARETEGITRVVDRLRVVRN
jgi:osmotically-inducible protein OsmY